MEKQQKANSFQLLFLYFFSGCLIRLSTITVHTFAYYISFRFFPLRSTFAKLPLGHYKFKYSHISIYRYALGYNSICFRTVIFIHRTLLGVISSLNAFGYGAYIVFQAFFFIFFFVFALIPHSNFVKICTAIWYGKSIKVHTKCRLSFNIKCDSKKRERINGKNRRRQKCM